MIRALIELLAITAFMTVMAIGAMSVAREPGQRLPITTEIHLSRGQ